MNHNKQKSIDEQIAEASTPEEFQKFVVDFETLREYVYEMYILQMKILNICVDGGGVDFEDIESIIDMGYKINDNFGEDLSEKEVGDKSLGYYLRECTTPDEYRDEYERELREDNEAECRRKESY